MTTKKKVVNFFGAGKKSAQKSAPPRKSWLRLCLLNNLHDAFSVCLRRFSWVEAV